MTGSLKSGKPIPSRGLSDSSEWKTTTERKPRFSAGVQPCGKTGLSVSPGKTVPGRPGKEHPAGLFVFPAGGCRSSPEEARRSDRGKGEMQDAARTAGRKGWQASTCRHGNMNGWRPVRNPSPPDTRMPDDLPATRGMTGAVRYQADSGQGLCRKVLIIVN